jgi:uncharacterized protein
VVVRVTPGDTGALHIDAMAAIIGRDAERMRLLSLVRGLGLPDCWIAAGFLRNAVWDALHGRSPRQFYDDVDVIWFDPGSVSAERDAKLESDLARQDGVVRWSVKNQARMHRRNGDAPYASAASAMCHWVETTAAVAVQIDEEGALRFSTPLGTDDLFDMVVRAGPRFRDDKHDIFLARVAEKRWFEHWPLLRLVD